MLSAMNMPGPFSEFSSQPRPPGSLRHSPLTLAAFLTWLAVSVQALEFGRLGAGDLREWAGLAALVGMFGLFLWREARDAVLDCRGHIGNSLAQGLLVVVAEVLLREGQIAVLLIIVAVQLVLLLPVRRALAWLLLFNFALWAHWTLTNGQPLTSLLYLVPLMGFQAFAALTGYYAGMSERAREHLAQVNAELLATQRLLEESARSGERLKLSRELHDVAGHKLTALKLNLARLRRDPALAAREEIASSAELADELLSDIRAVVSALRQHDGLELESALRALARPIAGTRIEVEIEPGLRVDSVAQAETLLRCAQEAITNALRHGRASLIRLSCRRHASELLLEVSNDGEVPRKIEFGNGLTGMRERLLAQGGWLELEPRGANGFRLRAHLPEALA
jgi:signal transduction histidine kinase